MTASHIPHARFGGFGFEESLKAKSAKMVAVMYQ
jgi:hypothetical protein